MILRILGVVALVVMLMGIGYLISIIIAPRCKRCGARMKSVKLGSAYQCPTGGCEGQI